MRVHGLPSRAGVKTKRPRAPAHGRARKGAMASAIHAPGWARCHARLGDYKTHYPSLLPENTDRRCSALMLPHATLRGQHADAEYVCSRQLALRTQPDVLQFHVGLQTVAPQLTSHTARLPPTERHPQIRDVVHVDADSAAFQPRSGVQRSLQIPGVD